MKKLLALATLAAASVVTPALAADAAKADIGVSISVSQPGVYGRIDIGRFPQPTVVVQQPVIVMAPPPPRTVVVQPQPVVVARPEPVYMWVPPGHRKNWKKHCRAYNACGVPVYFVRDDWYDKNVRPHGDGHGRGRDGDDRGHGRGHGQGKRD